MIAAPPHPARELAAKLDPVVFSRLSGIDPDPWQADVLRSTDPEVILNCSRQSGKSTTTGALAVHTALYRPGSLILLLSPGMRQSGELFKKCAATYAAVGKPVPAESETALTLTLENGSRIVSLPGKDGTVRGFSGARLIVIDEAAWVMDALYYAIRPMLAVSGGRLILMSTPFGKRGFFHHEWTEGGSGWRRFRVPAEQCPRISREFLDNERMRMPAAGFDQEYGCEFGELEGAVFSYEQIQAALDDEVAPLWA
jgi:hypothetical protein